MKIALVHDYLVEFGGAERVLVVLHELFPDAPIYTFLYDKKYIEKYFPNTKIIPSYLNILPHFIIRNYRRFLLPFLSSAARSFDLSTYDIVISSSSAFAKACKTAPHAMHICYCHSPTRFLWDYQEQYQKDNNFGFFQRFIAQFFIKKLQKIDLQATEKVNVWIANSRTTQKRIKKYYKKDAMVIYPPLSSFPPASSMSFQDSQESIPIHIKQKNYFLVVSRLSAYKKIDLIIKAFNVYGKKLIIVGDGSEKKYLKKIAHKNIVFTGFVPEKELSSYYMGCKTFILANEEDFGLSALEAASFGKPVLAYKKGGATEWMEEGKTGEFFKEQTEPSLLEGIKKIELHMLQYNSQYIIQNIEIFNKNNFKKNILSIISNIKNRKNNSFL